MSILHKLVVDFDKNRVILNGQYLGTCTNVGVVTNESTFGGCTATITLPLVQLSVIAKSHEYRAEGLES